MKKRHRKILINTLAVFLVGMFTENLVAGSITEDTESGNYTIVYEGLIL